MAIKDKYFTISEAAREMNVTRQTISRWISQGKLVGEKIGRETLIKKKDLSEYQQQQLIGVAAEQIVGLFYRIYTDYCQEKGYIKLTERVTEVIIRTKEYAQFAVEGLDGTSRKIKFSAEEDEEVTNKLVIPKLAVYLKDFSNTLNAQVTRFIGSNLLKESKGGE